MAARRLQPYRQGRLDGLCGVYALINALRLLCPRLDEDACERAFCALIRARARQTTSPVAVISGGLSRRELLRLLGPWQRFAAKELGVALSVSPLKVSEPSLRGIWRGLRRVLDGQSIAILGLDGAERHWTVVYAATERTLRVADSDARGRKLGARAFAHSGEGLAAMAAWILELTGAAPEAVFVAIEVPHGPVVESLMERGFRVHAINPKQLDRFRDRFSPAGAKDDSRDAEVLGDALRTDPRCFRALQPLDPVVVELREGSRMAEDLKQERNRLGNRVRELLWRFYPQMLGLTDDVAAPWFLDLWRLIPTPEKATRVREATVDRLLKRHRIRRLSAADVLERLRTPAIPLAPGTVSAATAHLEAVAKRLDLVNRQMLAVDERLDRLTQCLVAAQEGAEGRGPSRAM